MDNKKISNWQLTVYLLILGGAVGFLLFTLTPIKADSIVSFNLSQGILVDGKPALPLVVWYTILGAITGFAFSFLLIVMRGPQVVVILKEAKYQENKKTDKKEEQTIDDTQIQQVIRNQLVQRKAVGLGEGNYFNQRKEESRGGRYSAPTSDDSAPTGRGAAVTLLENIPTFSAAPVEKKISEPVVIPTNHADPEDIGEVPGKNNDLMSRLYGKSIYADDTQAQLQEERIFPDRPKTAKQSEVISADPAPVAAVPVPEVNELKIEQVVEAKTKEKTVKEQTRELKPKSEPRVDSTLKKFQESKSVSMKKKTVMVEGGVEEVVNGDPKVLAEKKKEKIIKDEPSEEEIKARLNRLLRGEA